MKIIILTLFTTLFAFGQDVLPWNTQNPVLYSYYMDDKWCDSTDSTSVVEDYLVQWIYNGNVDNCLQPSEGFIEAWWTEGEDVPLILHDTYDCCCKDASTPGHPSVGYTGFGGSACEEYLISINWDPIHQMLSIDEDIKENKGVYIDMFGRRYSTPPKGLSIMNNQKYLRL
jgi:hypothetical protein